MTETSFEAPTAEGPGSNRKRLVAGGAAAVVVLGAAGFLLLHPGGSSSNEAFTPVVHHAAVTKSRTSAAGKAAVRQSTLPAASTVKIGRDPFAALYMVPVAPAANSTASTATTTSTTTTSATGAGAGGSTSPAVPTRYTLTLLSVTGTGKTQTAAFSVAGKTQYARVGSVFGRTSEVKLLSFQQIARGVWSVTVQVGDDNPADLAKGESISVL